MDKIENKKNTPKGNLSMVSHCLLWGIGFGLIYWILESVMHVLIFQEGTLFEQIFFPDIHEIWMRMFAIFMIFILVSYGKYMIDRLREEKNTIKYINRELDQIFNTAADGMRLIDKNFNVLRINKTLSNMTGIGMDEAISKKCYETFHGSCCHTARCPLEIIINGEEYVGSDVEKERKDGNKIFCIVTAKPFRGINGELIGIVEDFKDITERKQSEKELSRRAEELNHSNSELAQFAYVASHDLQEPLRMISSYVQLLSKRYMDKLDADADDFINYVIDGTRRMQDLINDLLTFSRIGKKGMDFKAIDSGTILEHVLENLQTTIKEAKAVITHEQMPIIIADSSQLVQLFQNLLSNALKFKGKEAPRIHISTEKKDDAWIFSIHDNGIGIDPEYAERIFIIFRRLHSKTEYEGTGIGLAICKKIVERHGGHIWIKSESGRGSAFYFSIPNIK